VCEAAMVHVT